MIERAITNMPSRPEVERGTSALIGFSERLAAQEGANGAFEALAWFAAESRLGVLLMTIDPGQANGGPQVWTTLSENRLRAFRASGAAILLEDLMPSMVRPSTMAWSTAARRGFHRVGDAAARAQLFAGSIAGGIAMAMTLPSGRAGRSYVVVDDQQIACLAADARDLFLIASIHALLSVDRSAGPLATVTLTRREFQMLELFEQGMRAKDIADATGVVEATVKFHLLGARRKLNARTTREAAAILRQGGSVIARSNQVSI